MATVTELASSRPTGRDSNGKRVATRVFLVDMAPDAVLASPPDTLPIPGFSTYPSDGSLICDSLKADYRDGSVGWSEVRAEYSNDRSATFGGSEPVNPTDPMFRSWSVDWRVVDQGIPYWVRNPARYAWTNTATNPPTESFITGYELEDFGVKEVHQIVVRRSVVTAFDSTEYERIGAQVNTLHRIGAKWYLYSSGSVEETNDGKWRVEHVWQFDPGTPNAFRQSTAEIGWPKDLTCVVPGMYPGILYARPPFHGIIPSPGIYDPGPPPFIGPPRFTAVPGYAAPDPGGWQTLPGMP